MRSSSAGRYPYRADAGKDRDSLECPIADTCARHQFRQRMLSPPVAFARGLPAMPASSVNRGTIGGSQRRTIAVVAPTRTGRLLVDSRFRGNA